MLISMPGRLVYRSIRPGQWIGGTITYQSLSVACRWSTPEHMIPAPWLSFVVSIFRSSVLRIPFDADMTCQQSRCTYPPTRKIVHFPSWYTDGKADFQFRGKNVGHSRPINSYRSSIVSNEKHPISTVRAAPALGISYIRQGIWFRRLGSSKPPIGCLIPSMLLFEPHVGGPVIRIVRLCFCLWHI